MIIGRTTNIITKPDVRNAATMIQIMNIGVPWPMRHTTNGLQLTMKLRTVADDSSIKCIGRVVKLRATGGYRK